MFCGVKVIAIMHCTVGLHKMSWACLGQYTFRAYVLAEVGTLLVELISIHEPQTLFARLKSSGRDLGEGVMTGGAGEAYASLASRHNEST